MRLHMVTGAPGAGKSTTLDAFLALRTGHVAFDVDWLAAPASELAGRSVYFDRSTWPAYSHIWFEVLRAVGRNCRVPVLFAPFTADDVTAYGRPEWCDGIEWMLLDCADDVRAARLADRSWAPQRIAEALADAAALRTTTETRVDTGRHRPEEVARCLSRWLPAQRGRRR
jgi:hypothetical protein